jgi:hypothetical protein
LVNDEGGRIKNMGDVSWGVVWEAKRVKKDEKMGNKSPKSSK